MSLPEDSSRDVSASVDGGRQITFHYQKGSAFRVIHGDGVYGGTTPRGHIHFAVYNERAAIPKTSVLTLSADREPIGSERITSTLGGVVRELEVDVIMDFAAAASFHAWLKDHVERLRDELNVSPEDWAKLTEKRR